MSISSEARRLQPKTGLTSLAVRTAAGLTLLLTLSVSLAACGSSQTPPASPGNEAALFHLTHWEDDPHRVVHALRRAGRFAAEGVTTAIYLDIDAAPLAVQDGGTVRYHDHDARTLLLEAQRAGAQVMVCGACLTRMGKSEADLIEGARRGEPRAFFALGSQIVTFDY